MSIGNLRSEREGFSGRGISRKEKREEGRWEKEA
jgi:hypothetical protein